MYRNLAKAGFFVLLKHASLPLYRSRRCFLRPLQDDKVPILTYHKITDVTAGIDAFWNVSPSLFSEQMAYLARNQYRVISLEKFYECLAGKEKPPSRSVVLTFDDGYANFLYNAFPILAKYRFHATLFLTARFIDDGHLHPWDLPITAKDPGIYPDVRTLTWSEIKELQTTGLVGFGSHSMTHPHLGLLSRRSLFHELAESKARLESNLKQPVEYFSYPGGTTNYGDVTDETENMVKATGYRLACTSEIGRNRMDSNQFRLKRLGVCSKDTVSLFRAKVSGALDWVGKAQHAFQKVFANVY